MTRRLILFLREPVAGRVKTRLAAGIGVAAATAFYRAMASAAVRRLGADPRWSLTLAVTPDNWRPAPPLFPGAFDVAPQGRGDIGVRMARLARLHGDGDVVIAGTDIPDLGPAHVAAAFRALGQSDMVFGPAMDGGFWLVGYRAPAARKAAFGEVRWSGSRALADSLANLGAMKVSLLAPLSDVDDVADYRAFRQRSGQVFLQPRHQFDEVAGPVPAVELVAQDVVPRILAGAGGTGQGEEVGAAGNPAGRA